MAELLSVDKDMAASFLNSVLNQLNWAFSEFIGMIQEVRATKDADPLKRERERDVEIQEIQFFTYRDALNPSPVIAPLIIFYKCYIYIYVKSF